MVRPVAPAQRPMYSGVDHGRPISIRQVDFLHRATRTGSWGSFAESFVRFNESPLRELDVAIELTPTSGEPAIQLLPGARAGAIPLRSAHTGSVVAGLVIKPRFGWSGVGQVLNQIGWAATPQFLDLPLVPGSARHVPPWVLAGPVLFRIEALLANLVPGYAIKEEVRQSPRGELLWPRYLSESLAAGVWHRLPCRYPDLTVDPGIRRNIKWALERVRSELVRVGATERIGALLVLMCSRLLRQLNDVIAERPRAWDINRGMAGKTLFNQAVREGLQALGWVADERGLGGGQEMDGMSWQLPLETLWEQFVEAHVREEVRRVGGEVRVGRLRETVFPLQWSNNASRSMTHLVPDIVVRRGDSLRVVDAKYKSHFAELDEHAWTKLTDAVRESHRADVHQILAYASLYDAKDVVATLIYPLRRSTWDALREKRRDVARAELFHGKRTITLELRGLPFGVAH